MTDMMLNSPYTADQMGLHGLSGLGADETGLVMVDCTLPGTEANPVCRARAAGDAVAKYWPIMIMGLVGVVYLSMRGRY